MKTKNLTPVDENAWKKSVEDHNKDYNVTEEIFEILGSMKNATKVNINIDDNFIRVFHNGEPIDVYDMRRLLNVYTHNITDNKKGTSQQGIGWRAVASSCSQGKIDYYTHEKYEKYSFMVSKVKNNICIKADDISINYDKNEIVTIIHAQDFYVNYIDSKDTKIFSNIYEKYLKNEYGVIFQIPNTKTYNISDIQFNLRQLFNRFNGEFILNNVDILKKKKFNYIDNRIKDTRYLDLNFSLYTYKKSKVLKMTINDKKDINSLIDNIYYFNMKTYRTVHEITKLDTIKKWEFDGIISELEYDNYSFSVRMMGFDPDKHEKNTDFSEWYRFYTSTGGKFIGDGIIPYIDDICLRYNIDDRRKGYLKIDGVSKTLLEENGGELVPEKHKNIQTNIKEYGFTPSSNIHRRWGDTEEKKKKHTEIPVITNSNDKYIRYKPNQYYLCELIESRSMCDNENTLINKTAKKNDSTCSDSSRRGYGQTFPYFLTFLMKEYIWFREKEENIKTLDEKKYLKEAKELAEAEKRKAEEARKQVEEARKQLEEEKKQAEEARKQAEEARKQAEEERKEKELSNKEKKNEELKKVKAMLRNKKLREVLEEELEEKEEFEKEVETNYVLKVDEKNIIEGYCYCLNDPSRPNWRKIGYSSHNKDNLLKQYPKRFFPLSIKIVYWSKYKEAKLAEKNIFNKLNKYRIDKTEWFDFKNMYEDEINKLIEEEFIKVQSFMNN